MRIDYLFSTSDITFTSASNATAARTLPLQHNTNKESVF